LPPRRRPEGASSLLLEYGDSTYWKVKLNRRRSKLMEVNDIGAAVQDYPYGSIPMPGSSQWRGTSSNLWGTAMSMKPISAKTWSVNGGTQRHTGCHGRRAAIWRRTAALAVICLGLSLASLGALADPPGDWGYGHYGMWGGGWGGMMFGFFMMLLVIAAIVAVVVLVVRVLGGAGTVTGKPAGKTSSEILDERFARGEIDSAEFEERRRVLAKGSD
jgi:putative membrane protein